MRSFKMNPLAHSARNGVPAQSYATHVSNVSKYANYFAKEAAAFSPKWRAALLTTVGSGSRFHDLGKLDRLMQGVLEANSKNVTGFNHVDAGTAHLCSLKQFEAALSVYSHHLGLPSIPGEKAKGKLTLRDTKELTGLTQTSWQRTDKLLSEYLVSHYQYFPPQSAAVKNVHFSGLVRRLALSCLVDADHSDTAQNYRNERELSGAPLRAAERLAQLDRYVDGLSATSTQNAAEALRSRIRADIYRACHTANFAEAIVACDAPVGSGKTTAVMAHLLRTAQWRGLRRIFVILPFTNIIDQSVDVYRRSLTLPGEDPEQIVADHHHRTEFIGTGWRDLRQLTQRWDYPIVVTTAVQFFETLAACNTARLRKLHQLPGSAIFVDEAHAAIPAALWPQSFKWLTELCRDWSCHLVLGSGSLVRFWQRNDFVPASERPAVAELIPEALRAQAAALETRRVELKRCSPTLDLAALSALVHVKPGPRLVIFNTIQSAATFANHLRKLGASVEHLSSALTPFDRKDIIKRVRARLRDKADHQWFLVATSCVEAGVDFSFRTAFRESCGLVNILQIAGRTNRSYEHEYGEVWDFRVPDDGLFSLHPQFNRQRAVLAEMFAEDKVSPEYCTEALLRELNASNGKTENKIELIKAAEKAGDYPLVADQCQVIISLTKLVVVEPGLIARLRAGQIPSSQELVMHSVQVWDNKFQALDPEQIGEELYALRPEKYDNFLGYMRGLLQEIG
jgi:CRISPR-associated endonuclease/helicase Cas3